MKNLKYMLFSILIVFIYINKAEAATCIYNEPANFPYKYTITCKTGSSCTVNDPNNTISIKSGITISIGDTCPSEIYTESANNEITNISLNGSSDNKHPINRNLSTEGTTGKPNGSTEPNEPSTNAEYENDSRYIEAQKDIEKYCRGADISGYENLKAKCEEARKKAEEVKALYEGTDGDFDPENFCKGPVQGVFTTLGWVFFVIKIVIPILLIIFGSIDVGKAVIASKDDEIKKSIKTLAIRTIAGIIIFLIPTILNLAVKLIDNSEVYNGTFWDCTKCMLDPVNSICSGLRSEQQ